MKKGTAIALAVGGAVILMAASNKKSAAAFAQTGFPGDTGNAPLLIPPPGQQQSLLNPSSWLPAISQALNPGGGYQNAAAYSPWAPAAQVAPQLFNSNTPAPTAGFQNAAFTPWMNGVQVTPQIWGSNTPYTPAAPTAGFGGGGGFQNASYGGSPWGGSGVYVTPQVWGANTPYVASATPAATQYTPGWNI